MEHRTDEAKYMRTENESYPTGREVCDADSSADELAHCIDSTRSSMDRTLRTLESRLSPGRLFNRLRHRYHQRKSSAFDMNQTVSNHAIPFAIIGGGLAVLGSAVAAYAIKQRRGNGIARQERPAACEDLPLEEADVHFGAEPIVTPPPEADPVFTPAETEPDFADREFADEGFADENSSHEEYADRSEAAPIGGIEEAEARKEELEREIHQHRE